MRKNPSRYALMALAGLLAVFGLVLMVKMRDGGRALAQSAEPPLAPKSVPVDAKEKKGEPNLLPPVDALALPAPGTVTSTSAAAPPAIPPVISTVGAVDVPVPTPPPPVNVTGAVPPSPMGSEAKPIIIPAVAKEPAGGVPPPAVDVTPPAPIPGSTPPSPPVPAPVPTPPAPDAGKALPPIMVDVTSPPSPKPEARKPEEKKPAEKLPDTVPPPSFGVPTKPVPVPTPTAPSFGTPTPAPMGTVPPVSVDPVPAPAVPTPAPTSPPVAPVTPPTTPVAPVTPPTTPVAPVTPPTTPPAVAGGEEEVSVLPTLRAPKVKPTVVLPLTGTFTVTADGGKTITLPEAIRKQLGECETVLVSPGSGSDRCLWLTNQAHLDRLQAKLDKSPARESEVRGFVRLYYAQTVKLPVKDGKVAVTDKLATFAGLGAECVLVGIDDHFEIWDAAKWKRYTQAKKSAGSDD